MLTTDVPYFSIIIPCLNESQYLPRLLKNLKQQTFKKLEIIIVDGQSQDNTAQIARDFKIKHPLLVIVSDRRHVGYQRNLGAKIARGKVLVFFDADTQIPPNYLDKIHQAFETKHPHMLTTYVKVDSQKASDQLFPSFINLFFEISRMLGSLSVYGAMMAIKNTVFQDLGGFDEKITFSEDSELFQKGINQNYKYIILPNPEYTFSLRRFRSEGTLDTIYKYMRLYINTLFNGYTRDESKYKMGGHIYKNEHSQPEFIKKYHKLFNLINKTPTEKFPTLKTLFKKIFKNTS